MEGLRRCGPAVDRRTLEVNRRTRENNQANMSLLKEQNELRSHHNRVLNEPVESGWNWSKYSTMWLNGQQ